MLCDDLCAPQDSQMRMEFDCTWMDEAHQWIRDNAIAWDYFMQQAALESASGYASAKGIAMEVRRKFHVSINDKLTSSLARIAMERNPRIAFKLKKSKVDGYTGEKK